MNEAIWDFWASKYHKLWVQKHSLGPTRRAVIELLHDFKISVNTSLLDLGCGPGELIEELGRKFGSIRALGIDFSSEMVRLSSERNPWASHIQHNAEELNGIENRFDFIVCTHSFPYYKDKESVLKELHRLLSHDGRLIIAFASEISIYDKLVLSFVKLTTGKAKYPSHDEFSRIAGYLFAMEKHIIIKERPYMSTISVYQLRRKEL